MDNGNVSQLYDLRGDKLLQDSSTLAGSARVDAPFRAPYRYAEDLMRAAYGAGARDFVDICTGTGLHAVMAASIGYRVVGVDISPKSIEAASRLARLNRMEDRCAFEVADVASWAAERRQFDVLYISGSLYYLKRVMDLKQILELLRPGGLFVCVETNGSNPLMSLVRRFRALMRKDRDEATLNHLLRIRDADALARQLTDGSVRYFDLFTLGATLFRSSPKLTDFFLRIALPLDRKLFSFSWPRRFAFKFVLSGRVPVRS